MEAFYRRYLTRCNEHRFDDLGEFVDADVRVNGVPTGLDQYAAGMRAVVDAFPDYHWDLQHLLVDGDWLSAHLIDTGTHTGTFLDVPATGRTVSAEEFAIYRFSDGKIVDSWGNLDSSVRHQLT
ncbi:putative ester cyclase [Kribbella steppae]|uniref:Putative ester cyclase n=1 Tax=Kribbella steppae TaxID=2512223 RepID=A0A4R2HT78_9ACTN|nr:ester cyclase [Kribbella steppae]TCO34581.1 putative ester cyclase [Kribbella steppae]